MENKLISPSIVVSYKTCQRKAFLLLTGCEEETLHEYLDILEKLRKQNQSKQINSLIEQGNVVKQFNEHNPLEKEKYAINVKVSVDDLEASCDILHVQHNRSEYIPTVFASAYKIREEQKLHLMFIGYVLDKTFKSNIKEGQIIDLGGKKHKVRLGNSAKAILPILTSLREWLKDPSANVPPAILNKNCSYCQFFLSCKGEVEKKDDLSQLDRLNAKQIKRYQEKGIFTLKQLSFQFQPRRSRKRKQRETEIYKPELQALAIRTGNILIHNIPKLPQVQAEFFLDIEGIPEIGFHYLIGLLSCNQTNDVYKCFWANNLSDEEMVFKQFLDAVKECDAPIYHYGSYEVKAIRQLAKRYNLDVEFVQKRLVNLNSHIFGKIYFPVKSNKLKELGNFIGAHWSAQNASGIQSLVWRYHWDETKDKQYRELLIQYNKEDCHAAKLLARKIREISESAETHESIDFIGRPKKKADDTGHEIHEQFQSILKFAHADYDKKKIEFRNSTDNKQKKRGAPNGHVGHTRLAPQVQELLSCEPRRICPNCTADLVVSENKVSQGTFIDLFPSKGGYTRKVGLSRF